MNELGEHAMQQHTHTHMELQINDKRTIEEKGIRRKVKSIEYNFIECTTIG